MTNRYLLSKKIILGLATATLFYGPFGVVYAEPATNALPTDGKVTYGTATISSVTPTEKNPDVKPVMNIAQTTDKAIINWNTFNVGENATVNFIQTLNGKPNVAAMTLNRVVGTDAGMSEIAGHINSIGSIILVNPNGAMFYDKSVVNAAGVIVSTAEIDQEAFKNGQLIFSQDNGKNANITVNGTINASTNGEYMEGLLGKVKANVATSVLNTDKIELATGFSFANNTIKLVADGDITVGAGGALQAVTTTTISGDKTVGSENFSVEGDSNTRQGSITLRADQNADNVAYYKNSNGDIEVKTAKIYLNNNSDSQIAAHNVGIYYNPDIVNTEADASGIDGLKVDGNPKNTYVQKDYTKYSEEAKAYNDKVANNFTEFSRNSDKTIKTVENRGIVNQGNHMLVNDIYQMEAIQYSDKANLYGSYAQGKTFDASDTENWNGGAGFKAIGLVDTVNNIDNSFHGSFTGSGGTANYSIKDLTINRPTEDNVGLFGVAKDASFWSVNLEKANITGNNYVAGIAGQAANQSTFSSISVSESSNITGSYNNDNVSGNNVGGNNVGGIVGEMTDSTIRFSSNSAKVSGHDKVGGLAGSVSGGASGATGEGYNNNIYKSHNSGTIVSTGKSAGGLVGYVKSDLNTKDEQFASDDGKAKDPTMASAAVAIIESYSNGSVEGKEDVGGIVGTLENGTIQYTYNTNEKAALSSNSVVSTASVGDGTSVYGKVHGAENVGGIVGNMTGGAIDQSYNAGNVDGTTNVGGVVGTMSKGAINKAYNADNNTVLKTSTNDAEYYGFKVLSGEHAGSYTYDNNAQTWKKYTTENGVQKCKDIPADQLKNISEDIRVYNNRLAYRDATVTGSTNVGGIAGTMSNGSMNEVYNAGRVKGKEGATNVGAFVGNYSGGIIQNSFYVTTANDGSAITGQDKALGNKNYSLNGIDSKTINEAQSPDDIKWTGTKDNSTSYKNTGKGWTIYNNSSTPLLNHFMKWININRQYQYDGTVHNLMTTDVDNYYGGAFFDNGDGKNVFSTTGKYDSLNKAMGGYDANQWVIKSGTVTKDDNKDFISVYTYDNSTMWSPQHGYYTSNDARMIITPKTLTVNVIGEKTYGNDKLSGAEFGTKATKDSGIYAVNVTGFVKGEGIDDAVSADGQNIVGVFESKDLTGTGYNLDKNELAAGTYTSNFTNPKFELKENNHNYRLTYNDKLIVHKANLDITVNGSKEYGDTVNGSSAAYSFTYEKSDKDNENNGKLKSWDNISSDKINSGNVNAVNVINVVYHNDKQQDTNDITEGSNVITNDKGEIISYEINSVTFGDKSFFDNVDDNNVLKNYNVIAHKGTMTITPAALKVTSKASKTYGQDAVESGVLSETAHEGQYSIVVDGLKRVDSLDSSTEYSFKYKDDKAGLGAGTYEFKTPIFTDEQINGKNYNISYSNTLTVDKADLNVGLVGTKTYGMDNSTGIYKYYALNRNTDASLDKENNGNLKTFDFHNSKYNIPVKNEGLKPIPAEKITSMEATENVKVNGVDSDSKTIGTDADMLIYRDTDGKYAVYSYKLGNVVLIGTDIEANYNLHYSNLGTSEGTMTIMPPNTTKEPTGRLVIPDSAVPANITEIEKPADAPAPYVPPVIPVKTVTVTPEPTPVTEPIPTPEPTPVEPVTPQNNVIDNPINEIVVVEVQEIAEDTKAEVTEESKKIRYGGYIPKDARDSIRFITVEDTGINVEDARVEHTTITIAPDSLVDGNKEVVISGDAEVATE
ncbi:filamentous hemagglutinin N-terminal domain-containing protein [Anaerovibrio sp. RM50]|uniref:two-partner secretion domain-containing protein n=1 Tax=Anaerovibrio sp. RM50 TaxID=1200557 RepID=UPI000485BD6E|nr:filamentous hemagglutinin N-terminal domain-containing protein [Anaerovibrio sp. RM50]